MEELDKDKEVFFRALTHGKIRTLSSYLDGGADVNMRDSKDETPLIRASKIQKEDIRSHVIRMLIRYGADINLCDVLGRTALMHACIHKQHEDVVRRIIGTGKCDVNTRDDDGNTALMHAVVSDNVSVIRILANSAHTKGMINVNLRNNKSKSPLELAMEAGYLECVYILVKECSADTKTVPNKTDLDILMKHFNDSDPANILKSKTNGTEGRGMSKSSLRLDKISLHSRSLEKHDSTENNIGSGGEGDARSLTPVPAEDQYPILKPISNPASDTRRSFPVSSKDAMGKYALSPRGQERPSDVLSISTIHSGSRVERGALTPILPVSAARPDDDSGLSLPPLPHSPNEKKSSEFHDLNTTSEYSSNVSRKSKKKESILKKRSASSKRLYSESDKDAVAHVPLQTMMSRGRLSPLPTVRIPDPYDGDDENPSTKKSGLPSLKNPGKGRKYKHSTSLTKVEAD